MVEEPIREMKWEPLQERSDAAPLDVPEVQEEEGGAFSLELIQEVRENYTDEQRQNLYQKINEMGTAEKLRLSIVANREARNLLIHDPNKVIPLAVLKNRKVNESEVLQYAKKRDLPEDVLLAISKDQKWKKSYPIKFALVSNPKTPLSAAIQLLPHLQERDLKSLSRGNDVSSVLRRKAQEILHSKNKN